MFIFHTSEVEMGVFHPFLLLQTCEFFNLRKGSQTEGSQKSKKEMGAIMSFPSFFFTSAEGGGAHNPSNTTMMFESIHL